MSGKHGLGLAMLLLLAMVVLVGGCMLIGYAVGMRQVSLLHQSGYTPWPGSSFWADVMLNPLNAPASSVWSKFTPGAELDFAFTYAPGLRAAVSGLAMLCGGGVLTLTLLSWRRNPLRAPFLLICWGLFGLGVAALIPVQPVSFGVDLNTAVLRNGVLTQGEIVTLQSVTGFSESALPPRFGIGQGYALLAFTEGGSQFVLAVLNNEGQAVALTGVLEAFVSSKGQKF